MIFLAVLLFSVSAAANTNMWNSQTVSFSDLLKRLNDLEERLQIQERINGEQEAVIKRLIIENINLKNIVMPKTDISVDIKKLNESEGFTHSPGNSNTTGEKTNTVHKMHLSNSKSHLNISDEHSSVENCCQKMLVDFKNNGPKRRAVTGGAAFYSYLSDSESNPNRLQIIIFDHVITNVGGNYNHHMGFFYSPMDGVYTFSWTLYCSSSGYIYSEIVVNSDAVGAMLCNGEGASSIRHSTGVVVVQVNQGDAVYIRTHPSANLIGRIHSYSAYRSSFSGWNLF